MVPSDWDDRLDAWRDELELLAKLDDTPWVPLAIAEAEAGYRARRCGPGTATARSHPDWLTDRTVRNGWYRYRRCSIGPRSQPGSNAAPSARSAWRRS